MKSLYFAIVLLLVTNIAIAQVSINISDASVMSAGEVAIVPVKVTGFNNLVAMQFSVEWDTEAISFQNIGQFNTTLGLTAVNNFGQTLTNQGKLVFLWVAPTAEGIVLMDSSIIFALSFKAIANNVATNIEITANPAAIEVVNENGTVSTNLNNGVFTIGTTKVQNIEQKNTLKVFQNQPNPFTETSVIPFELTERETVTFSIYNMQGQMLFQSIEKKDAGTHYYDINRVTLPQSGVYTYRLETTSQHIAKRFAILD